MKKIHVLLLSTFLLSAPAFAAGVNGSCRLLNVAGSAELRMSGEEGEIIGATGVSPVRSVTRESAAAGWEAITIRYVSQLAAQRGIQAPVRVVLMVTPTSLTAAMGYSHQGVLLLPIHVPAWQLPGPFSYSIGSWNNPLLGFLVPTQIPAGYAVVAGAYCRLD